MIQKALETNRTRASLGIKGLALDFDTISPGNAVEGSYNEVALGDMNGNSIRLLHELVQTGIVNIKKNRDAEWKALMQDIDGNRADRDLGITLRHLPEVPNKVKRLVNFLQEARSLYIGSGITAPLLYAQLEKIKKFANAEIENNKPTDEVKAKGLVIAIDLFHKSFEAVPANEDTWFYNFSSDNPDDPLRKIQEKLKSMPDYGNKRPISVLLKKDEATLKTLMDRYTLSYESKVQDLDVQLRNIINRSITDTSGVSELDKTFFPFRDSPHPIVDALTRTKKNYDADIERTKKARAAQNHDAITPRVLDAYDQLIDCRYSHFVCGRQGK